MALFANKKHRKGVANKKLETSRDGETIVLLCEHDTLSFFKLQYLAFRVF